MYRLPGLIEGCRDSQSMQHRGDDQEERGFRKIAPGAYPEFARRVSETMAVVLPGRKDGRSSPPTIAEREFRGISDIRVQLPVLQEALGHKRLRIGETTFVTRVRPEKPRRVSHHVGAKDGIQVPRSKGLPYVRDDQRALRDEVATIFIVLYQPVRDAQRDDGVPAKALFDDSADIW